MNIRTSRLCVQASFWVLASAFCVTSLTGCGATSNFTQGLGTDTAVTGLHGTVHGGPNPVNGATVTLYATTSPSPTSLNNYGYGDAGTVLGTAQTAADGTFSFTSPATCTSGQQAYIVAAGGHTGSNATNSAAVLMAALGPCSSLVEGSSGTTVFIDEPTTIAAAYALSGFMTVSGTTVNISAPANNNAATASCKVVSNATTACAASGLAHAFLNAATLVNTTTGVTNSTVTNPSTLVATVPQALINTLANTVEACINSSGSSSSACTTLFTNTTPTALNSSATAPANTLQALLDLAQYPSMALGAGTPPTGPPLGSTAGDANPSPATTALFNAANSNAYYSPALSAAPDDFTIAINYALEPVTGTVANVWGLDTDIEDNLYAYAKGASTGVIYSIASDGAQNWETASTTTCGFSTTGARCTQTPDTLGNLWVTDSAGLTEWNASTGVQGTTYTTGDSLHMALVDEGNNVWLPAYNLGTQAGASALEELPRGGSAIVEVPVNSNPLTSTTSLHDLAFDSAGNLWTASDATGGGSLGALLIISSNNSLTSPAFATAGNGSGNPQLYLGGQGSHSWDPLIDGSGNAWVGSEDELNEIQSGGAETGGAGSYAGSMTLIYGGPSGSGNWEAGVERNAIEDGDGKFIVAAASGGAGYISVYYPNAPSDNDAGTGLGGADVYLNPCHVASGTTCEVLAGGQAEGTNTIRGIAIDATGAIWASSQEGTDTDLIQVLGPGAPSWGQRSWIPAALAPNLTGNATSLRPF